MTFTRETLEALTTAAEGARELAENGEAVDGYISLAAAVDAFLRGETADAITEAAFIS